MTDDRNELTDTERVRRALDLIGEARELMGFTPGAGQLKQAEDILAELDGVEPIEAEGKAVERLRDSLRGRFE